MMGNRAVTGGGEKQLSPLEKGRMCGLIHFAITSISTLLS